MDNLSLMKRFADPVLFEQMTSGDKLAGALVTTLMGMGITFVVLAILWGLLVLMAKVLHEKPKTMDNGSTAQGTVLTSVASIPSNVTAGEVNDSQLVAVIMAAIAASQGTEYASNLVIRKINRISGNSPSWGKAGVSEAIDTRRF